jgi:hypothetical protein
MSRKQREDDRRKIACVERDPIWAVYSKAKHVLPPQHVQELEARRMDHLPHGITRDGTYMFMRKDSWTVCDGVAYRENNWTIRREFDERQYKSIGYLNFVALTKMAQTLPAGPAREALESVLKRERWYWERRNTERQSDMLINKLIDMVVMGDGNLGVYEKGEEHGKTTRNDS